MLKETTYKEKFEMLASWMPSILETIKRDLKNDHLRADSQFCKRYLQGKNPQKASLEDLVEAYQLALKDENSEAIGEFIANRWMLKHTDIYAFFENKLNAITSDFMDLEEIEDATGRAIAKDAVIAFGPTNTYLFSILNSVVFSRSLYNELAIQADAERKKVLEEELAQKENKSLETLKQDHKQEVARLTDKYEKKLIGMQKKYLVDTERLKNSVSQLQAKLSSGAKT